MKFSNSGVDVTKPPYNADPTGITDSTTAIQAAIYAANCSNGAIFLPAGQYLVTSTLNVENDKREG